MKAHSECAGLLAEVTRGEFIESRHFGHLAVVAGTGRLIAHVGDPEVITFLRSSAKPFQALPLIRSGAADHFGFSQNEIALACGSHGGEPIHTLTAGEMLRKAEIDKSALRCGIHDPFNPRIAREQQAAGSSPDVLQNNCSGKHAGMLAVTKHLGESIPLYNFPDATVQRLVREGIARFSDLPLAEVRWAVDGCGVPTFAVSVRRMALMFARIVAPPKTIPEPLRHACQRIVTAMTSHPEMVAGDREFDTELMRQTKGRLISKIGAEGVFGAGILPCDQWPAGFGVAFKIEDGSARARSVIAMQVFWDLGILNTADVEALAGFARHPVRNHRGETVGNIFPRLSLKLSSDGSV